MAVHDATVAASTTASATMSSDGTSTTATATTTTTTTATMDSSSLFGTMVRSHLLDERRKEAAAASVKRKPRKKRKKKKWKGPTTASPTASTDMNGATSAMNETSDETATIPSTSTSTMNSGSNPQHDNADAQTIPPKDSFSSSSSTQPDDAPATTATTSTPASTATFTTQPIDDSPPPSTEISTKHQYQEQQQQAPPLTKINEADAIVNQWLDRLQPPQLSTETAAEQQQAQQPSSIHHDRTLAAFCQSLQLANTQNDQSMTPTTTTTTPTTVPLSTRPRLSIADISAALRATKCIACRSAAEAYWQSTGIPMVELGLVGAAHHAKECLVLEADMVSMDSNNNSKNGGMLSIPVAGHDEWGSRRTPMDRAFDYQAMEEGTRQEQQQLEGEANPANTEARIVVLEPVADKEGTIESIQVTNDLDVKAIERLVRQIILPCGLVELEHPNALVLSKHEFESIVAHVEGQQQRIWGQLQVLQEKKATVQRHFTEASDQIIHPISSYDVKAATALTKCDTECDDLLTAIATMLLQMTTLTDGLPSAQWAHTRTASLWQSYEKGVQSILKMSLQHEAKLLQLANRPGVVPQLFMNAAHRASFRNLVHEKTRVLGEIYTEFFTALCTDESYMPAQPTFFRRLLTCQPFTTAAAAAAATAESDETNATRSSPLVLERTELDVLIGRLVEAFTNFIHSVRSGHVTEIHNAQEIKSNQLFDVLRESTTMVTEEYNAFLKQQQTDEATGATTVVDQNQWKALRKEGTDLISQYSTYQSRTSAPTTPTAANDADGDVIMMNEREPDEPFVADFANDGHNSEALAAMRLDLAKLVINMISQWRCLRLMRSQPFEAPTMPLRLIQWMNQPDLVVAMGPSASTRDGQKTVCGGGKRRLGSVLSSLLYQWLVDRCNEWHAELTQSELLEAMEELAGPKEMTPSKASKKRKKKKAAEKKDEESSRLPPAPPAESSLPEPSKPESMTTIKTRPVATDAATATNAAQRKDEPRIDAEDEKEQPSTTMNGGHQHAKQFVTAVCEPGFEESKDNVLPPVEAPAAVASTSTKRAARNSRSKDERQQQANRSSKKDGDTTTSRSNNKGPDNSNKEKTGKNRKNQAAKKEASTVDGIGAGSKNGQKTQQTHSKDVVSAAKDATSTDVPKNDQPPKQGKKHNKQSKDRKNGIDQQQHADEQGSKRKQDRDATTMVKQGTKQGSKKKKGKKGEHNGTQNQKKDTKTSEEEEEQEDEEQYTLPVFGVEDDMSGEVTPVQDFLVSRLFDLLEPQRLGSKPVIFL
jgi:hypothetical protein